LGLRANAGRDGQAGEREERLTHLQHWSSSSMVIGVAAASAPPGEAAMLTWGR
jgi:hypothetical protein